MNGGNDLYTSYGMTHRPFARISSYIALGAISMSPCHVTAPSTNDHLRERSRIAQRLEDTGVFTEDEA
jgi:hypothetical protein